MSGNYPAPSPCLSPDVFRVEHSRRASLDLPSESHVPALDKLASEGVALGISGLFIRARKFGLGSGLVMPHES